MESVWRWALDLERANLRADLALLDAMSSGLGQWTPEGSVLTVSRSQLKRLFEQGLVLVDGAPAKVNAKLGEGAQVEVRIPAPSPLELVPEDRELAVLFEDEHLLVINKPPGLTVHPSPTQAEGTLVHALLHHVRDLSGIGGKLRPGIVHRIDKDTSGALVVTKTDAAHQKLAETFSRHEIERAYWALCYSSPMRAGPERIETLIGRNPNDRKKMSAEVKEGRRAVTEWRRLEEYGIAGKKPFASWIEARLETGRTHQVRVHLTGLGHSLLGDPVYGVPTSKHPKWMALPDDVRAAAEALPGQALHARVLGFTHPITGEKLKFEAEPPAEFAALLALLKAYA